jgi:hypothetical protein
MVDEIQMRAQCIRNGIPITTTLSGIAAAIEGLKALRDMGRLEVSSIQEFHRHSETLNLK